MAKGPRMEVRGCVWGAARILEEQGHAEMTQGLLYALEDLYQERKDLHPDPKKGDRRDELLAASWLESPRATLLP